MLEMMTRGWWVAVVRGICAIVFGILAVAMPLLAFQVLVILFGAYAFADGILAVSFLLSGKTAGVSKAYLAFEGITGIATGIFAFCYGPVVGAFLVFVVAAWAILTGIMEIIVAIRLRKEIQGEWWLLLSGIVSILFGGLLTANPGAGEITLGWMAGVYALIFGSFLVMLGLRLRKAHQHLTGAAAAAK